MKTPQSRSSQHRRRRMRLGFNGRGERARVHRTPDSVARSRLPCATTAWVVERSGALIISMRKSFACNLLTSNEVGTVQYLP